MTSTKSFPVLLVLVIFAACQTAQRTQPDFLATDQSRGRELLIAASRKIEGDPLRITNNVADFLARHHSVLADAKAALELPGEAPARDYQAGNFDGMRSLMDLRKLANLFFLEGEYATEQHHISDAADACMDAMRLGQSVEHGPLIDLMIGSAIELGAIHDLEKLAPQLGPDDLRRIVPRLIAFNKSRIAFSEIRRRELYFGERNKNHPPRLSEEDLAAMFQHAEERYNDTAARTSILAANCAAARFRSEHGKQISKLEDLVPEYMEAPPIDPYANAPLRLAFREGALFIYSVGPNKRDDSGQGDDISAGHKDGAWLKMLFDVMRSLPN